jgi:hypothetical protein
MNSDMNEEIQGERRRSVPYGVRLTVAILVASVTGIYAWRFAAYISTALAEHFNAPWLIIATRVIILIVLAIPFGLIMLALDFIVFPRCDSIGHVWINCRCARRNCSAAKHNWRGCKCVSCGETNHVISNCSCRKCGTIKHNFSEGGKCHCAVCGVIEHDWVKCYCRRCHETRHEYEMCRCRKCGAAASDEASGHHLENCKCINCGKQFRHLWPDLFNSERHVKCLRPNCSVVGEVAIDRDRSGTTARVLYEDPQDVKSIPLKISRYIDPNDAEWVYRYTSAPKTRAKLRGVPRETIHEELRLSIHSPNESIQHIAAFLMLEDYPEIFSHLRTDELRYVEKLLHGLGKALPTIVKSRLAITEKSDPLAPEHGLNDS